MRLLLAILTTIAFPPAPFYSGQHAWTAEWVSDGLLLRYEASPRLITPADAQAAARDFLRAAHMHCIVGEADSARTPGYVVSVSCPKHGAK